MIQPSSTAPDLIEEFRLRRWARLNFVPAAERSDDLHPVILHEMSLCDLERQRRQEAADLGTAIVPLCGEFHGTLNGPHYLERSRSDFPEFSGAPEFHFA